MLPPYLKLLVPLVTLLLGTAAPAHSAGNVYIGLSRGWADTEANAARFGFAAPSRLEEVGDVPRKFFVGYQFNPHFAVEGGYFNVSGVGVRTLPPLAPQSTILETAGWDIKGIGILPLSPSVSLFAKLGVYWANTEAAFAPPVGSIPTVGRNYDEMDMMGGGGIQWAFEMWGQHFGLRAEWERYLKLAKNATFEPSGLDGEGYDANLYSLGLTWKF